MLDLRQCVTLACLLDVTVPKPGNVHRGADFEDATFLDFAASAVAIAPHIAKADSQPLGRTILDAITATQSVVGTNTNLGIVLLLAPLAAVARHTNRAKAIAGLMQQLTDQDSRDVFKAIRLAEAGGLGTTDEMDVYDDTSQPHLLRAMELAKDRDRIAAMYVSDFDYLLNQLATELYENCAQFGIHDGILSSFLENMSRFPDTLIARKCGTKVAEEAATRASDVQKYPISSEEWYRGIAEFDFWLRSDGNKRNPGTTADMITAGIFLALIDGLNLGKMLR